MRKTVQRFIADAVRDARKSNVYPSGTLVVDSSNNQVAISKIMASTNRLDWNEQSLRV
jgi:hypothetical protein